MISHDGRDFLLGFQTNECSIIILHSNHILHCKMYDKYLDATPKLKNKSD